jgi:hypothetical protein
LLGLLLPSRRSRLLSRLRLRLCVRRRSLLRDLLGLRSAAASKQQWQECMCTSQREFKGNSNV